MTLYERMTMCLKVERGKPDTHVEDSINAMDNHDFLVEISDEIESVIEERLQEKGLNDSDD